MTDATRPSILHTVLADELEAAVSDAACAVIEVAQEIVAEHGLTNSEMRAALATVDRDFMARFRTIGLSSAWDDRAIEAEVAGLEKGAES
jgi:hypothetical protein